MGQSTDHVSATILCCDIGGSSLRIGLIDEEGNMLAQASCALVTPVSPEGVSEVDPAQWWELFQELTSSLSQESPSLLRQVVGISICGMTRTQILVDERGQAVRPAITWRDSRADAEAAELNSICAGESIDAYHPAARLAWVRRHEPGLYAAARTVIEPKDYLALRLTLRSSSDPISLARLLGAIGGEGTVGGFRGLLPELLQPSDIIGNVVGGLSSPLDLLAGVPVFMASNDTWTAVVGLGALRPAMAYNIVGTSEVLGLISSEFVSASGLMSVDWGLGLCQIGGPSQNGADVIPWLAQVCSGDEGNSAGTLSRLLAGERHQQPVLFLPFLQGERVPYWDPDLRGAFFESVGGN